MANEEQNNNLSESVLLSLGQPTKWITSEANRIPDKQFLDDFKQRLLRSEEARGVVDQSQLSFNLRGIEGSWPNKPGSDESFHTQPESPSATPYPQSVLSSSDACTLNLEAELDQLRPTFPSTLQSYIYLDRLDVHTLWGSNTATPPYLDVALAGLTCLMSEDKNDSRGHSLFMTAVRLFIVTLELDNREARRVEGALAAVLLAVYGLLTGPPSEWRVTTNMLAFFTAVTRRLAPAIPVIPSGFFKTATSHYSILLRFGFLVDTVAALHFNLPPGLSSNDLKVPMLSSNHSFRTVYDGLFTSATLPEDVHSPEDGLLLLTAILSDTLFIQRNLASITVSENSSSHRHAEMPRKSNPYATLSPDGEYHRQKLALLYALDRWHEHFGELMSSNILAYYFFCRVCLFYPHLGRLAESAGYTPQVEGAWRFRTEDNMERREDKDLPITEEALDAAWRVLDHVNHGTFTGGSSGSPVHFTEDPVVVL
ncbi:hypothetical protein A0O28_0008010 [Trichoderma guizhouense]|uniref:Transcription factor domain-containing protein n=1 Tax=Trichoderma guizhouense TaxID=1491466 RepID=A0A1T3CI96_9HYPO|nr:hypothetical protein A0O28_0008010 [Trichoderma guizhouense]